MKKYQNVLLCLSLYMILTYVKGQETNEKGIFPEGRASGLLLYHPQSKGLLLFDGYQIHFDSTKNDVWKWNGIEWKTLIASGPETRNLSAGALNTKSGEIQIYGGVGKDGYEKSKKKDMWTFNGQNWKQVTTNDIGSRDHHKMVYADHLDAFILYGGQTAKRDFDTVTWVWKNNNFVALMMPGPGIRYHYGMAYDRNRKKVVIYGGGKQGHRDELWEFDGKQWLLITSNHSPGRRLRHNMVYNDDLKMIVLHGGSEETNGWTWAWDGKDWQKIAEGGPTGNLQALGYDPLRKVIVAYGGSDFTGQLTSQLWELKDGTWKKISDNGSWKWVDNKYQKVLK